MQHSGSQQDWPPTAEKGSDDPKHPGWPAGAEGGRGGQFRPKDASELTQKVKSVIARRALRTGLLAGLRIGIEALGNLIPVVDVAADVAMAADIALTVAEFRKLAIDAAAALDFVKDGPHSWRTFRFHRMVTRNSPAIVRSTRLIGASNCWPNGLAWELENKARDK